MQFKLKDLYNTKYFYVSYCKDINYLCLNILELQKNNNHQCNIGNDEIAKVYNAAKNAAEIELDLAGCQFTPDVYNVVLNYIQKGLRFIDTELEWRNEILQLNWNRFRMSVNSIPLPKYSTDMSVPDYIRSLEKDVVYKVPDNDEGIYIHITFLITYTRPSIQLYLGNKVKAFMEYVGSKLILSDLLQFHEFYLTTPEGTRIVDFSKGDVYVQHVGYTDIEGALTSGVLVPTVVGKEKLNKYPCFRRILKDSNDRMNNYIGGRKRKLNEVLG